MQSPRRSPPERVDGIAILPRSVPGVVAEKSLHRALCLWGRGTPILTRPKLRKEQLTRQSVITPEGLEKLKEEIETLSTTKRREVAERIKEAREFGDISENAEYDDAKNEQALLESRIAQLEERLRRATVIDEKALGTDEVKFGSIVHVKDQKSGNSQKFQIVGSTEANPAEHRLSNESPIGKALIGRKRNDVVSVDVPRGPKKKLKITKIEAA